MAEGQKFDARLAEGVSYFEQMLEIMPEDRTTLEFLVVAYEQLGEPEKGQKALRDLAQLLIKERDIAALTGLIPRMEASEDPRVKAVLLKVKALTAPEPDVGGSGLDVGLCQGGWTFRHHHHVGTVEAAHRLAEPAGRKHVVASRPPVFHQYDVQSRPHTTVLEGIVEHDDIGVPRGAVDHQQVDAMTPVCIDSHQHIGKLRLNLQRLIADVGSSG